MKSPNSQVRSKIYRFCAYQERSHREVKQKLLAYGIKMSEADEILAHLITEGFVNEERFAKAFAGGKFRMLKWGRLKIQLELEREGLTGRCIKIGLAEINSKDYLHSLSVLLHKKKSGLSESDTFKKKNKLARFAIAKGYEPELVWELVNDLIE